MALADVPSVDATLSESAAAPLSVRSRSVAASPPSVLACQRMGKVYRMGEIDLRALDGFGRDQRARYFGELLITCASCHRSVGAELDLGPAAPPHASTGP